MRNPALTGHLEAFDQRAADALTRGDIDASNPPEVPWAGSLSGT
jgi:hypothetical protein